MEQVEESFSSVGWRQKTRKVLFVGTSPAPTIFLGRQLGSSDIADDVLARSELLVSLFIHFIELEFIVPYVLRTIVHDDNNMFALHGENIF